MEIINIGICLEDRAFGRALAKGLAREAVSMRFFLLDSFAEGDFCDLILTSGSPRDSRAVEMVRDPKTQNCTGPPPYSVYRYKESQNLINDLLFIYFKLTGKVVEHTGTSVCKVLIFLAEGGCCGTTSTAISCGKMLNRIYGARTLYLNLCPLDDSRKYLEEGGEDSLLKLLYYLEQNRAFPMSAFITETEDIDYVNTGVMNTYFNEMKPVLMERFLKKVDSLGKYEFLILDVGNHLCRENKKLLSRADCAVFLSDGQRKRPGKYRENISREISKRLEKGRMISVENFADDDWDWEKDDRLCITRQEDESLQLVRNYGTEIGVIAREIMEGASHGTTES